MLTTADQRRRRLWRLGTRHRADLHQRRMAVPLRGGSCGGLESIRQVLICGCGRHTATIKPVQPQYRRVNVVNHVITTLQSHITKVPIVQHRQQRKRDLLPHRLVLLDPLASQPAPPITLQRHPVGRAVRVRAELNAVPGVRPEDQPRHSRAQLDHLERLAAEQHHGGVVERAKTGRLEAGGHPMTVVVRASRVSIAVGGVDQVVVPDDVAHLVQAELYAFQTQLVRSSI
uniref:(northern house mosquito) hypothetical protein n=1 Tax=Culex pipiens TaxID=7175 RepID=A0A8D8BI60_CULPI